MVRRKNGAVGYMLLVTSSDMKQFTYVDQYLKLCVSNTNLLLLVTYIDLYNLQLQQQKDSY